jgi:homoserine dehydrogenase
MSTKSTSVTQTISVAVVGVGLVGAEFVRQLLALAQPHPFRLVSLSSSKTHIFAPDGLQVGLDDWQAALSGSSAKPDIPTLVRELAVLVTPGRRVVLVDNTASDVVAGFYPEFLRVGVNVVTPNKKAFSSGLDLHERILAASLEAGTRFLNEATVGAGLPIISTLKDLVATGDEVCPMSMCCAALVNDRPQVTKIEGVFSGTMSYIFNEFSTSQAEGPSFSSVVKTAREKGYTARTSPSCSLRSLTHSV